MTQLSKRNKLLKLLYIFIATLTTIATIIILEYAAFRNGLIFSKRHICIYSIIYIFILINIIFDYKKIWSFIFKYRVIIAIGLFILCVAFGLNTSSIGIYGNIVQPNQNTPLDNPLWGILRPIRSDEFLSGSPTYLSQSFTGNLETTSKYIMAANGSVLLFPKVQTLNISVLSNPYLIGFLFLDTIRGFSFYNMSQYFIAFMGTFEFLLIFTNNNKFYSLLGTLLLVFSPTMLWWNSYSEISFAFITLTLFYYLLKENSIIKKIILSIFIGWSGCSFIAVMYPAWQIPYSYLYLTLAIWIIIENRRKIIWFNFFYLIISIIIALGILLPSILGSTETLELMSETVYPGSRLSYGGDNWEYGLLWASSPFFSIFTIGNPCEFSSYISLFPVPMILSAIAIIKNKINNNNDWLLILLLTAGILLSVWNFVSIGFAADITLLSRSTTKRAILIVGAINVLLMLRLLQYYSSNKTRLRKYLFAFMLAIVVSIITYYAITKLQPEFISSIWKKMIVVSFSFICVLLMSLNSKKFNKLLITMLISISCFLLLSINPLTTGLSSVYDKPVSKTIHEINNNDPDAIWISANKDSIYLSNFTLCNGSRVLNSVNFYPQMDIWHKIDPEKKYEDVYNRYAHITFTISNSETHFQLITSDSFTVYINPSDLKKLNISYVISNDRNLSNFSTNEISINQIYLEDNTSIYKIN